jgi:hypothetical protein
MKIEALEILLVLIIVSFQVYVFITTYKQIRVYKNIIPNIDDFRINKLFIPSIDIDSLTPKQLLENANYYRNNNSNLSESDIFNYKNNELKEINIIEVDTTNNFVFDKTLFAINNYLIRNRGSASDFNLIKDIVERNTDSVEEDINLSIGIPLYLGLMGTMIGIIIGLFNMPDLATVIDTKEKDLLLNEGIGLLIGGVKIAMIASFTGLLFTIINSGWLFKGSKSYCEARKHDFYSFIQIELLPILNQGLSTTFESLQRNLLKFNEEFSYNLRGLTGIFDSSRNAIKEQKDLLDALDKAKVSDMTRYNVAVLKQLDVSVSQFEKFNQSFVNINQFVENSQSIVSRTNELLARTDDFKNIASNIDKRIDQSHLLMQFLSDHFNKLNDHKEFTNNAVAEVGFSISETFKELKLHIQHSTESVKQFTVEEIDALKEALSASRTNLSNLEHLATLKTDVTQFKNSSASQGERMKNSIDELNVNMLQVISVFERIEKNSFTNKAKGLKNSIKNLFKSKK